MFAGNYVPLPTLISSCALMADINKFIRKRFISTR
nr:MAG TPA: hypothetical protein [Caudoviricetes sp.]